MAYDVEVAPEHEHGANGRGAGRGSLEGRLADAEAACVHLSERCERAERLALELVELYTACYRLHGSLDREEILSLIARTLSNPIGAEAMGVYRLEDNGLRLVTYLGIDPERHAVLTVENGPIAEAVRSGESHFAEDGPASPGAPAACVPLHLNGTVIGAIVIFRLRESKAGFASLDRELLALLSARAGLAMYCGGLHRELGRRAA